MSKFNPNIELYGKPAVVLDLDGKEIARGTLDEITSPFDFVVSGCSWSIGSTDQILVEDDVVYLNGGF